MSPTATLTVADPRSHEPSKQQQYHPSYQQMYRQTDSFGSIQQRTMQHSQSGAYSQMVQHPQSGAYSQMVQHPQSGAYSQMVQHPQSGAYSQMVQHPQSGAYSQTVQHPQSGAYSQMVQHPQNHMMSSESNVARPMISHSASVMSAAAGRYAQQQRSGMTNPVTLSSALGRWSETGITRHSDDLRVISERIVEHEVRVPKKVLREDILERVIVVPEKVMHEEVVEEMTIVREKIIEVARPIIQERIVEVPEIEIVEKVVEVPQIVYQEKVREIPRVEFQERIIEVPKIITQERVVEVPEIEYQEIPYEKIIEVPEIHEQIVIKPIPVPQYIDKPIPEYVDTEVEIDITRHLPVPVESVTTIHLQVPQLRHQYSKVDVPLYVPRFIEVAMPADLMDVSAASQAEQYAQQVALIAEQSAPSLCEVERLGGVLKNMDGYYAKLMMTNAEDFSNLFKQVWSSGTMSIKNLSYVLLMRKELEQTRRQTSKQAEEEVEATREKEDAAISITADDLPPTEQDQHVVRVVDRAVENLLETQSRSTASSRKATERSDDEQQESEVEVREEGSDGQEKKQRSEPFSPEDLELMLALLAAA